MADDADTDDADDTATSVPTPKTKAQKRYPTLKQKIDPKAAEALKRLGPKMTKAIGQAASDPKSFMDMLDAQKKLPRM